MRRREFIALVGGAVAAMPVAASAQRSGIALVAKQLELLKLVAPDRTDIAAMFNPTNVTFQTQQVKEAKKASEMLGLQLRFLEVREPSEFEAAFDTVARERIGVLLILADPL